MAHFALRLLFTSAAHTLRKPLHTKLARFHFAPLVIHSLQQDISPLAVNICVRLRCRHLRSEPFYTLNPYDFAKQKKGSSLCCHHSFQSFYCQPHPAALACHFQSSLIPVALRLAATLPLLPAFYASFSRKRFTLLFGQINRKACLFNMLDAYKKIGRSKEERVINSKNIYFDLKFHSHSLSLVHKAVSQFLKIYIFFCVCI